MKITTTILTLLFTAATTLMLAQECETWVGKANQDKLEESHSVYRGFIKTKNFADAFEPWKMVYDAAPAADGKRDYHYTDGIKIYKDLFQKETDEAKKKEYVAMITGLYDQAIECYQTRSITLKAGTDEAYATKIADLYSRKSYDMYYELLTPYSETMEALQYAFEIGGLNTPYTIIVPYANIAVYQFQKELIDKETARLAHDELMKLADHNIANGHQYAEYYEAGRANAVAEFKKIQYQIFDCEYFKGEWMADYEDNKDDPLYARDLYNRLKGRDCADTDPFLVELKTKYEEYAAAANAAKQAEFEANNPRFLARKAYEAGDFEGAISKYRDAINLADDNVEKAKHHFSIASILFRKQNKYSAARSEALKAAELDPTSGRPYSLIGDIYAKSARGCGDSWNQSLAIIAAYDKWAYAKGKTLSETSMSSVQSKLSKYSQYFPDQSEGFMRGSKKGAKEKVGCWIGETVSVRFK